MIVDKQAVGIACALTGAILWGFSGSCVQYLFAHYEISALTITVVRMLGAGVLFLAVLLVRQRETMRRMLSDRSSVAQLIVFGSAGLFLCQVTYILAIDYTNAGTATVLQGLNMVFVLGTTCLIARRWPSVRELLCVVLAFAAIVSVATKGDLGTLNIPPQGLFWGIATAAAAAVNIMYPRRLFAKWGSLPVTGTGMLVGGFTALLLILVADVLDAATGGVLGMPLALPQLGIDGILALAAIALVGTFAAFGLYMHGISLIGSVSASLLGAIEPISATAFAALWLGTVFVWADWLGLALMVATIVLISRQQV